MKKLLTICCFILAANQIHANSNVYVSYDEETNTLTFTLPPVADEARIEEMLTFMDIAHKTAPLFISTMRNFIIANKEIINLADAKFTSNGTLKMDKNGKIVGSNVKGGSVAKAYASFTYNNKEVALEADGDVSYRKGAPVLALKFTDTNGNFGNDFQDQIAKFIAKFKKAAGIKS